MNSASQNPGSWRWPNPFVLGQGTFPWIATIRTLLGKKTSLRYTGRTIRPADRSTAHEKSLLYTHPLALTSQTQVP